MPVAAVKLQKKIIQEKNRTIAELTAKLHAAENALHEHKKAAAAAAAAKDIGGSGDAGVPGDVPGVEVEPSQQVVPPPVSAAAADSGHEQIYDFGKSVKDASGPSKATPSSSSNTGGSSQDESLQGGASASYSFVTHRRDLKGGQQHPFYVGMYYK